MVQDCSGPSPSSPLPGAQHHRPQQLKQNSQEPILPHWVRFLLDQHDLFMVLSCPAWPPWIFSPHPHNKSLLPRKPKSHSGKALASLQTPHHHRPGAGPAPAPGLHPLHTPPLHGLCFSILPSPLVLQGPVQVALHKEPSWTSFVHHDLGL